MFDNDLMAVAALSTLSELGVRVPGELSVLAWDDSALCEITHPQLSAMSHDVMGLGAHVAHRLFDLLEGAAPAATWTPRRAPGARQHRRTTVSRPAAVLGSTSVGSPTSCRASSVPPRWPQKDDDAHEGHRQQQERRDAQPENAGPAAAHQLAAATQGEHAAPLQGRADQLDAQQPAADQGRDDRHPDLAEHGHEPRREQRHRRDQRGRDQRDRLA
jgi:hypothetical protein